MKYNKNGIPILDDNTNQIKRRKCLPGEHKWSEDDVGTMEAYRKTGRYNETHYHCDRCDELMVEVSEYSHGDGIG